MEAFAAWWAASKAKAFLAEHWLLMLGIAVATAMSFAFYFEHKALNKSRDQVTTLMQSLKQSEADLALAEQTRTADQAADQFKTNTVGNILAKEAQGRAETVKALQSNPNWANQPVPQSVLDSLRK